MRPIQFLARPPASPRRSLRSRLIVFLVAAATLVVAAGSSGCTTDAFCFDDCPGNKSQQATSASAGGSGGQGGELFGGEGGCGIFGCAGDGGAGGGTCAPTNGGVEKCDGVDNDCNGAVDDGPDIDFSSVETCGTCNNNCAQVAENCTLAGLSCTPSPNPGTDPGTCACSECLGDWIDLDGDGVSCEYYCVPTGRDEATCDNQDDDCDGLKDEEVDLCTSLTDCGICNKNCVVLHGTPACQNDGNMPCDGNNTTCVIQSCDCNGPGDCWHDLDGSYATGCEYNCSPTNGGVEICGDGLDNDCDGKIDGADDLSGDPAIGVVCYGDPDGECATAAHAGTTECQGALVVCTGANVLKENQVLETCNGLDDDCDGTADDSPTDAGGQCGVSNVFPCSFGAFQCQGGQLVCIGAVNPGTESCNGVDDDCDGTIDKTNNQPPADSVGACNVPIPPPANATSPCMAGTKACVGGVVVCQGSVTPAPGATDTCGVDANCDGILSNQPNLQSDTANCGMCGNNCYSGSVHSIWSCDAGTCQYQGCEPGYYDLNNDQLCEYACTFISAQESCNGVDDNCNGTIDEGVVTPSPAQVCGVSPVAMSPECTSQVSVACTNGTWQCTFPANVCDPSCAQATEICDGLDNDCDGVTNENVPNFGKPCASDDGLPPPGHGACKTTGTFVCNGPQATSCSAMKANCANLPGGCTELCDGVDNDCDGTVDEAFNAKGTDVANFVKPTVTKLAASLWTYSYEASRPTATNVVPGTGNGYHCTGAACQGGVPPAPAGETLDKTRACSVPNKIPWFNVSPIEVEQTCQAMGGFVCSTANWQTACQATVNCSWGYNPRGAACTSSFTGTKFCNLQPSYDFDPGTAGDQDGLLPTASAQLQNCFADWSNLQGNTAATNKVFDITGNVREIVKQAANQYKLMGGAFNSAAESGSTCQFTFYTVNQSFKFYDTGFRCCFSADPTL